MIITVLQENLLRALSRTGRIVSPKPQLPIVQNVLLNTHDGQLQTTTTNLETTESVLVGAKIEKPGGICVSSKLLTELVASLPPDTVSLSAEEGTLRVVCGKVRASLPGVAAGEFPQTGSTQAKAGAALEKDTFISALQSVLFAAATDEGRPLLAGVRMSVEKDTVVFAATDGYRLSVKRVTMGSKIALDMVVPARALLEVVKVGTEEKKTEQMTLEKTEEGQLVFGVGDTHIYTRLIDGEYPNFQKIIPRAHTSSAIIDTEAFMRAVKSAAIFARDSANIIKLLLADGSVTVSANTPQVGENSIELEAKTEGEGGEIAFNSRFLLEFLSNFSGQEVVFEMTGSLNPGLFKSPKDDSFLHIIMPVRVQG